MKGRRPHDPQARRPQDSVLESVADDAEKMGESYSTNPLTAGPMLNSPEPGKHYAKPSGERDRPKRRKVSSSDPRY